LFSPSFSLYSHPYPPHPPSFPTRRSSDLSDQLGTIDAGGHQERVPIAGDIPARGLAGPKGRLAIAARSAHQSARRRLAVRGRLRSEEHTSELQSLTNPGCRLLLEQNNPYL